MTMRVALASGVLMLLAGCGPRDEFPHQTVEAYQSDDHLRQDVLQKCADHIARKRAFGTQSDADECRYALAADRNLRLARHQAMEQAASNAALRSAAAQFEGNRRGIRDQTS